MTDRIIRDLFSGHAPAYAAGRPVYSPALAEYLAGRCVGRALALDVGCGSGQFSTLLAPHFSRVLATDASEGQLRYASPASGVHYAAATAHRAPIASATADLISAAQAAHWFDLPAFFAEARRVGKPGALVALLSYGKHAIDDSVDAVAEALYSGPLAPYWAPERRLVETGYRTIDFPFAEVEMPSFDMTVEWTVDQLIAYIDTWSASQGMRAAGGGAELEEYYARMRGAWGPTGARRVSWPLALRVGRM